MPIRHAKLTKGMNSPAPLHPMFAEEMARTGRWLFRRRSYLPLLLGPLAVAGISYFHYPDQSETLDRIRELCCLGVSLTGLGLRIATVGVVLKGSSGRNTKGMKADHLNQTGLYSVVRHPLYLANFLVFLGVFLFIGPWWLPLIGSLIYWLYYERIMFAEESLLFDKYGPQFSAWAAVTPAVIPRWRHWRSPEHGFSLRSVIRREYTTLFLIITLFTAVEVVGDYVTLGRVEVDPIWAGLFIAGLIFYLTVRFLKKRTHILDAGDR